jgi:hypothetical protein
MHLGHYKSLLARHKYSTAVDNTATASQSESESASDDKPTDYELKLEYPDFPWRIIISRIVINFHQWR